MRANDACDRNRSAGIRSQVGDMPRIGDVVLGGNDRATAQKRGLADRNGQDIGDDDVLGG